jgi:protein TonB
MQIGSVSETITVTARPSGTPSAAPVRQTRPAPSTADPCSQSPAGGCLTPPIKLTDVRPQYPQRHADAGISGTVEFDGRIGTDGSLKELRLLSPGDPDFGAAALEAIRQWRFAPTRLGGVPVDTNIHITVRFSARQ